MAIKIKPVENMDRIEFGDGNRAKLIDVLPIPKDDVVQFKFLITERLNYALQVSDEDHSTNDWTITKQYKKEYCHLVSATPGNIVWWLFCDYYERPTELVQLLNEKILAERNAYKNRVIALERILNMYANELKRLGTNKDGLKKGMYKDMERISKLITLPQTNTGQQSNQQTMEEDDYGS